MSTMQALHKAQVDHFVVGTIAVEIRTEAQAPAQSAVWPELHAGVYKVFFATWAAFMGIFWLTFAPSAQTLFLLTFISIYAVIFFGLPVWMNRKGRFMPCGHGDFGDFLRGRVATIDGSVSGWEALTQVILVPVCLTVGAVAIALIINASRITY